ncbi:hypothetical protein NDU88_006917 [Pleurodeles waltl]|uniref:Uncharacterized protein n=1 Tax=Pleurodeles waltl TaxID=8319 RepID=A0AAV7TYZ0_PLEWA|nr:hypothetical protein NDU88_006917 [Pleurodeles waltl]
MQGLIGIPPAERQLDLREQQLFFIGLRVAKAFSLQKLKLLAAPTYEAWITRMCHVQALEEIYAQRVGAKRKAEGCLRSLGVQLFLRRFPWVTRHCPAMKFNKLWTGCIQVQDVQAVEQLLLFDDQKIAKLLAQKD